MASFVLLRGKIWRSSIIRACFTRGYSTFGGRFILAPEVPPDTPADNALMRFDEYPHFSDITPEKALRGCAKLSIQYSVGLGKHIAALGAATDFHAVFDPLERLGVPLTYAWDLAWHMASVKGDHGDVGYRELMSRIDSQVGLTQNERWNSTSLYKAVQALKENSTLDPFQERLVDLYLERGKNFSVMRDSRTKEDIHNLQRRIVNAEEEFKYNVVYTGNMFSHTISDFGEVVEFPQPLVAKLAVDSSNPSRGPWKVTLDPSIYEPFLQYCPDRMLRWNVWQAHRGRASLKTDNILLHNHQTVNKLRERRNILADGLGFANYAEMSTSTKMAGSVGNVLSMIENLKSNFSANAEEEITAVQEYATTEGFPFNLEMWDVAYWRRRHRDHMLSLNPEELSAYFPYPHVLRGLMELCQTTFSIRFEYCASKVDLYHPDVQFYTVFDSNTDQYLGGLYIDPYARPAKNATLRARSLRGKSSLLDTTPISMLTFDFNRPSGSQPCLLSIDDVVVLFGEFGNALQQLLTVIPYSEISGQTNIEMDALHASAKVMTEFLYHPHILKTISQHYETGDTLADIDIKKIIQMRYHLYAFDTMQNLYFSALDMEFHLTNEIWQDIIKEMWPKYIPLIPLNHEDYHPCNMPELICYPYTGSFYSLKWADMLGADIFRAFEDAGIEDVTKRSEVGKRYRDTFLSLAGGIPAGEVFRQFRGRDPSPDALVQNYERIYNGS